jgi:hypothetical protein
LLAVSATSLRARKEIGNIRALSVFGENSSQPSVTRARVRAARRLAVSR